MITGKPASDHPLKPMREHTLFFLYKLRFPNQNLIEFLIEIDKSSCTFIPEAEIIPQSWAKLEYRQCENCTLNQADTPYCPIALNLIPLLNLCNDVASYQTLSLEVITKERNYSAETTMQRAISSILGLLMATSACPHTEFFKPMARFHLPLAGDDETVYRATSMYLLAQYFRSVDGVDINLELTQLKAIYKNLQIINAALAKRLRAAVAQDATINGVVLLDLLTHAVNWSIEDKLEQFRSLFGSYGVKPGSR